MATKPQSSKQRSTGSAEWTPADVQAWLEQVTRQDEASARIRRSLGQIVTGGRHWKNSRKAGV